MDLKDQPCVMKGGEILPSTSRYPSPGSAQSPGWNIADICCDAQIRQIVSVRRHQGSAQLRSVTPGLAQ